ncbi:MAG: ThiF family adenylyltransferase [Alphaproteobacteria bacterium]|nr:ThiF family adenylyltransferase [Alphaproteobacteria bacterium]
MSKKFHYEDAFSRNLGLLTQTEQEILRNKKIAIAGMGGVGGSHLIALTRMGIQRFHIADMDTFEQANFNRQAGANFETIGKEKAETMQKQASLINPESEITIFPSGVTEENMDAFLDGVDIYVDGLDFFVLDIREKLFAKCRQKGIPAITAGPIGLSTACLIFDPAGMSFEEYFRLEGKSQYEKALQFLVGLTPSLAQKSHFVDLRYVDFSQQKGSSLSPACYACSAVAAAEAMKILLGRGKTYAAPWAIQFDMYQNRYRKIYNLWGNANPINKLKIKIVHHMIEKPKETFDQPHQYKRDIEWILNEARWAPSGDNEQPWKISITAEDTFTLDLSAHKKNVYNLMDMPDLLTIGIFLETAAIAAREKSYELKYKIKGNLLEAKLEKVSGSAKSLLLPYIKSRSVNRFRYKICPLPESLKEAAEKVLDPDIKIVWLESFAERQQVAKLLMKTTDIRVRLKETFEIHQNMIDWSGKDSKDKMPSASLGINPLAERLMKWALANKNRNDMFLKLPGATLPFQIELDLIPALCSSGHFIMHFDGLKKESPSVEDYIRAGRNLQRFWLTMTKHNISMQPWYIPLMIASYIKNDIKFTENSRLLEKGLGVHKTFVEDIISPHNIAFNEVFFSGRVGIPVKKNRPRSVRKDLKDIIVSDYSAHK